MHPRWSANYFMHEKFELPQLKDYVNEGSSISVSVGDYFSTMLDQSMNWHLDPMRRTPLDSAHEVADRNVGRYLDKHVDMLTRQHAGDDLHAQFLANLAVAHCLNASFNLPSSSAEG